MIQLICYVFYVQFWRCLKLSLLEGRVTVLLMFISWGLACTCFKLILCLYFYYSPGVLVWALRCWLGHTLQSTASFILHLPLCFKQKEKVKNLWAQMVILASLYNAYEAKGAGSCCPNKLAGIFMASCFNSVAINVSITDSFFVTTHP